MSASRKKQNSNHLHIYLVIFAAAALLCWAILTENRANTAKVDLGAYFASENGSIAVVHDSVLSHEDLLYHDGSLYASAAFIREQLNSRFFFDSTEELLLYTLPSGVIRADRNTEYDGRPVLILSRTAYVLMDYVARYTDMDWTLYEEPLYVVIRTAKTERKTVRLGEPTAVRQGAGISHPIMKTLEAGASADYLDESADWIYVCTDDGIHGYIAKDSVSGEETATRTGTYEEPAYAGIPAEGEVCLAWHLVEEPEDNDELEEILAVTKGVTVISPTWLHLTDGEGSVSSLASAEYVRKAHALGKDVWILVNNMDYDVVGDTLTGLLGSTSKRTMLEDKLLKICLETGADGLNVDFESVPAAAGPAYVQFIRELSLILHAEGLVLSVDNYVPSAWTAHYDRAEQGIFADYVVVMGYDEHYIGSEAGSTASLSFVTQGLDDTLKLVPAEKVINAVPFYTRMWEGSGDKLTSSVLNMEASRELLEERKLTPIWDEALGQNYVEFERKDGTPVRIWIEDTDSMKVRLEAIREREPAGLAVWRLGLETPDIWDLFVDYFAG